ncbi:hypothetical protein FBY28_3760 [Arthrobacter sp. SLBN-53]|nr:hypothetical protein FBY28_3760 [Arthrobacter sp. SLBN-53]
MGVTKRYTTKLLTAGAAGGIRPAPATVGAATGTLRLLGTDRDSGLGAGIQSVGVLVLRDLGAAVMAGTGYTQRPRGQAAGTLCSAHHCECSRRHWANRNPPSVPL